METAELLAFVKTVEARSVSRAALELGLPRATISRRLRGSSSGSVCVYCRARRAA